MPRVTVVTPVYNGARYLAAAVDSLLAQTFTDWELIAVDDGSTDETPSILARYDDLRIRTVRQENAGEAGARNRALSMAAGEFVAFLDADDLYLPNALADMTSFLDAHPEFDVVFSDGHVCDQEARPLTRLSEHRPGIYQGDILEKVVLHSNVITVPVCTMTRRAVIERDQTRFDTGLVIGPDWDFWIQLARTARFGYLGIPTCKYRVHEANITRVSGLSRRQNDLAAGRLKVLHSAWFTDLSAATRCAFLHHLLISLLGEEPERQLKVLTSVGCGTLPAARRADLWRRVGIHHLRNGDASFARECLVVARATEPRSYKTWVLSRLSLTPAGRRLAVWLIEAWWRMRSAVSRVHHAGGSEPRPVPGGLLPFAD